MADLIFLVTSCWRWFLIILLELGLLFGLLWALMAGKGPRWRYEDIRDGEEERE